MWRDTADLWPGEDWRAKIRQAITDNTLVFIACFSRSSLSRGTSYQNEELTLAIDQLRLRRPDDPWLIPVRLDECDIPDRDIGGGRTLASIQRADVFDDWPEEGVERLVTAVLRILVKQFPSRANAVARITADIHNAALLGRAGRAKEAKENTGPAQVNPAPVAPIVTDTGRVTQSITYGTSKAAALAVIAASLAVIDPARLLRSRHQSASWVTRRRPQTSPLRQVAEALSAIDPSAADRLLANAEGIAQSITDKSSKAWALADIAGMLAATESGRAEHIAQSITDRHPKAKALSDIARTLAAAEPDRARRGYIDSSRSPSRSPNRT